MDANAIEQRDMQVGERRPFPGSDVSTALQAGGGAARDQDRQILVIMKAGVTHAAAVQIERMIEERAVTVRRVLHALEEVREQRHMECIDLRDRQELLGIVAVMTGGMVRIRDADLDVAPIALLARELERDDARDVGLERQNLQIEHQLRMVGERRGNPHWPVEIRRQVARDRLFSALDLTLDRASAVEILIQACAIGNAHPLLEPRDVGNEDIEQAGALTQRRAARGWSAALAE